MYDCGIVSELADAFGDDGVGHGVLVEAAFFGLDADIHEIAVGIGVFEVAVAAGGYADNRAFFDGEDVVIDLEQSVAAEDDIILFVCLVAVEEGYSLPRGECAEGYFAGGFAELFFCENFAFEVGESADVAVGVFCTGIEDG